MYRFSNKWLILPLLILCFWMFQKCTTTKESTDIKDNPRDSVSVQKTTSLPLVYEDHIFKDSIYSVVLYNTNWNLSLPVLHLNTDEQLKLIFDDLTAEHQNYAYKIIHCNYDWTASDLIENEYISGFNNNMIRESDNSGNTVVNYIHYSLKIPNEDIQLTKSGNYILIVFENDHMDKVVLSKRFYVVDEQVGVTMNIHFATRVEDYYYKQEIDFIIDYEGLQINNPFNDVMVTLQQNGRRDNQIKNIQPSFVKQNQLVYDYEMENLFWGNNEYRYFDIKSLNYQSDRVRKIAYEHDQFKHVQLVEDQRRSYLNYRYEQDIEGRFLIKNDDASTEIGSEYLYVHFYLPMTRERDGSIYIFGELSNWEMNDRFKMTYDSLNNRYSASVLLKQGYYNYHYAFVKEGSNQPSVRLIEGTHSATENDYTLFVYRKQMGKNYDQLIAVKTLKSSRK